MPEPTPAQRLAAHQKATAQVRGSVLRFANMYWAAMGSYRDADIDKLIAAIVPRVHAGQIRTAELTSAYIASVATEQALAVDVAVVTGGRGVAASEVYRRPGKTVYKELALGASVPDAIKAGSNRLASLVGMDLQMAKVRQAKISLGGTGFTSYRRVLTGKENCTLCVVASTQRYHRGDLLPIHPGCDCGIDPIKSGGPLPQVLDEQLLEATHSEVFDFAGDADRSARMPDYLQMIVNHEHGEHGPSLRWRGQEFTGPSDI